MKKLDSVTKALNQLDAQISDLTLNELADFAAAIWCGGESILSRLMPLDRQVLSNLLQNVGLKALSKSMPPFGSMEDTLEFLKTLPTRSGVIHRFMSLVQLKRQEYQNLKGEVNK